MAASRLIGALIRTWATFELLPRVTLVFCRSQLSEAAFSLGKPELAPGFLLRRFILFGPASQGGLETQAYSGGKFAADVHRLIEPFNVGRFGDPARHNQYPVRADDLLEAGHKLARAEK